MAITFSNGFAIGATPPSNLSFFTNLGSIGTYLRGYMSDFRNPDFYEYHLDGDGFYIYDGGGDMFDSANATSPWLISNVSYTGNTNGSNSSNYPYRIDYTKTNNVGTLDNSFGYISLGYTQYNSNAGTQDPTYLPLTVIGTRATIASPGTPIGFQNGGNSGADGGGTLAEGNIYTGDTVSGFTVHSYYRETYDAGDPSHCDVYILLGHPDWNSVFGNVYYGADPVSNGSCGGYLYTSGGGTQNILAIKTLLSKPSGTEVTFNEVKTVVDNFIVRIGEAKAGATPQPTATPNATPTPTATSAPLSQYTPNGTDGGNGLITYLNRTTGLNASSQIPDLSGFNVDYAYQGSNPYTAGVGYSVGNGTYLYSTSNTQYHQVVNSFTIEMWFKVPSNPGSMSLIAAGANSGSGGWALRIDGAGSQLNFVKYNIADQTINLPSTLQTNTWHHIVVAQGGTSLMYMLDGEIVGSVNDAASNNIAYTSGNVNIGVDNYTNSQYPLTMGSLKIYDYCRLVTDILTEFNNTKGDYGFAVPTPTPTATVDPTPTATVDPTPTATVEVTPSPTNTQTPTPTSTPVMSSLFIDIIDGYDGIQFDGVTYTTDTTINVVKNQQYTILAYNGSGQFQWWQGNNVDLPAPNSSFTVVTITGDTATLQAVFPLLPTPTPSGTNAPTPTTTPNPSPTGTPIPTATDVPTPTPTNTVNGVGAWYFYSDEGTLNAGPPIGNGNAIFTMNSMPIVETFNPNKMSGTSMIYFDVKDSNGTDYTTQFNSLVSGGTITVSQNGDSFTYTSNVSGAFTVNNLGGGGNDFFQISTGACTQTKESNAPFVYADPISITFS